MDRHEEDGRSRHGENGRGLLATIALGWFLTLGVRFLFPALLPRMTGTFLVDDTTAGLAITAIWAGYGLMQFPAGLLADRVDERTLLSASLLVAGGASAAIGAAPVFAVFLSACGLWGLGSGVFGPARGLALSRFFQSNRGRAFGVTLAAGSIGSAAVPFGGGVLAGDVGWRLTVGLSVPLFLAMAVVTWFVVPAGTGEDRPASDTSPGDVLSALREAFTDRAVVTAVLGFTFMLFTFQALTAFLPTYLVREKALSPSMASALFALLFVAGAGFQFAGGTAVDRYGTRTVLLAITLLGVPTLAALPVVGGLVPLAVLVGVMATRLGAVPVTNSYVLSALPDEATGTAWGLLRTVFFLIGSTGSTVVGAFSDAGLFDEAFFLLAGLTAVAAALFWFLPGDRTRAGEVPRD